MKLKDAIHLFKSVREISRLSLQQLPWAYNDWCDGKYRGKLYYTAFTVGNNAPVNVMSPNPGFKCESWNMDRECVHVVMGCGCVWFPLWLLCSLPYASVDGGSLWCMFHNLSLVWGLEMRHSSSWAVIFIINRTDHSLWTRTVTF